MTLFKFAVYRAGAQMMELEELLVAQELARMAERGDSEAKLALRKSVIKALRKPKNWRELAGINAERPPTGEGPFVQSQDARVNQTT